MRSDLSKKNRIQAEQLLATVRREGSLVATAAALGYSERGIQKQWARWGLGEDLQLQPGIGVLPADRDPPAPGSGIPSPRRPRRPARQLPPVPGAPARRRPPRPAPPAQVGSEETPPHA